MGSKPSYLLKYFLLYIPGTLASPGGIGSSIMMRATGRFKTTNDPMIIKAVLVTARSWAKIGPKTFDSIIESVTF